MNFNTRIVKAPIKVEFSKIVNESDFKDEFDRLSESNDDPIGMWLKNLRARGKVIDENEPIFALLIELHRKLDTLNAKLDNERKSYVGLEQSLILDSIGHRLLIFGDEVLEVGEKYYGRIDMAVFPKREIPLYFQATSTKVGEIYLLHSRDEADFDAYITSRERSIIRESKNR